MTRIRLVLMLCSFIVARKAASQTLSKAFLKSMTYMLYQKDTTCTYGKVLSFKSVKDFKKRTTIRQTHSHRQQLIPCPMVPLPIIQMSTYDNIFLRPPLPSPFQSAPDPLQSSLSMPDLLARQESE